MATRTQAGFTLIEVMLVLAISSSLAVVAFAGQRQLRARAQFDASVVKLASTVAAAQTEASSGARSTVLGNGDGASSCPGGGPSDDYVFAGVAWTTTAAGPPQIEYYKASATAGLACMYDSRAMSLPGALLINSTNPPGTQGGREVFTKRPNGGLEVCPVPNMTTDIKPYFLNGSCPGGQLPLNITDAEGYTAHIIIEDSGLAKRLP